MTPLLEWIEKVGGPSAAARVLGMHPQQITDLKRAKKPLFVDEDKRQIYSLLREY